LLKRFEEVYMPSSLTAFTFALGLALVCLLPLASGQSLHTEWSYRGTGDRWLSPRVHDMDFDGRDEILSLTWGTPPALVCIAQDGSLKWQADLEGTEPVGLALGDLNGDSRLEVVAACSERTGSTLAAFDSRGQGLWSVPLEGRCTAPPMAVDMDWDGFDEIIIVDEGRGLLCLNGMDGEVIWVVEKRMPDSNYLSLADIDRDGSLNVLWFQNKTQSLWIVDSGGSVLRTLDGTEDQSYFGRPMIGDIELDGELELVICTGDEVLCLDPSTFQILWEVQARSRYAGALGDVDGDGDLELLLPGDGRVTCFEGDGKVRYSAPMGTEGWVGSIVIGDVDGDGTQEAVFPVDGTPTLHVMNAANSYLERSYSPETGGTFTGAGAALADGDWDGVVEIYVGTASEEAPPLLSISTHEAGLFTPEWPQDFHDWRGTSNYETTIQTVPEALHLLALIGLGLWGLSLHKAE
jgi:outer membrane protein assembly factor BamB